ncbi:hypothetical protein VaNZ11_007606, partial [Volvox africanus]
RRDCWTVTLGCYEKVNLKPAVRVRLHLKLTSSPVSCGERRITLWIRFPTIASMARRTASRNGVQAAVALCVLLVSIVSQPQPVVASSRTLTAVSVKLTVNGTAKPAPASTSSGGVSSTKDATTSPIIGSAPSATLGSQIASSNAGAVPVLPDGTITPISDPNVGGFTFGWRSASYGCLDCNFTDIVRRRAVDPASIYAEMLPWGALVLEADSPFSGNSQLDFWVKGAGVARASLYLKD